MIRSLFSFQRTGTSMNLRLAPRAQTLPRQARNCPRAQLRILLLQAPANLLPHLCARRSLFLSSVSYLHRPSQLISLRATFFCRPVRTFQSACPDWEKQVLLLEPAPAIQRLFSRSSEPSIAERRAYIRHGTLMYFQHFQIFSNAAKIRHYGAMKRQI